MAWIFPMVQQGHFQIRPVTDPKWITACTFNCLYLLVHHAFCHDFEELRLILDPISMRPVITKTQNSGQDICYKGFLLWPQLLPHRQGLDFRKIRVIYLTLCDSGFQDPSIPRLLSNPFSFLLPWAPLNWWGSRSPHSHHLTSAAAPRLGDLNHPPGSTNQYKESIAHLFEELRLTPGNLTIYMGLKRTGSQVPCQAVLPVVRGKQSSLYCHIYCHIIVYIYIYIKLLRVLQSTLKTKHLNG